MKTETRSRILALVAAAAGARPHDLASELALTPQAVHRHLAALLEQGRLEKRGRGPQTRYFIAGVPSLERVRAWFGAPGRPRENPPDLICETRDVMEGRVPRLVTAGLSPEEAPLAIAAASEVGNNSFDHNIGQWKDIPGCWFEYQITATRLWICIADRGQGVLVTLSRVDPAIATGQAALLAAFERKLSGRAPEQRGNGLKFVRNIVLGSNRRGLACRSGSGLIDYGHLGPDCRRELARFSDSKGTVTLLVWSLK